MKFALWNMWKSCPPWMLINSQFIAECGGCGKLIHSRCGQLMNDDRIVESVENLSTKKVENWLTGWCYVEMWKTYHIDVHRL